MTKTDSDNNTRETLACLIIDDPLLKLRYGCLDYQKLLAEMKEHHFFTEIAFIPWNYKRSDPRTVRLFAENPDYFGICVHGCNHTYNEFGGSNYQEMSNLSATALWRMEQHKRLTGLLYDPVMVFPQGLFSSVAMQALKDQGFRAAFNSTLRASDGDELPASEYEQPATAVYADFPLFLRRYPRNKSHFGQDMEVGRPILIVEHPSAFRDGYKAITGLIDWINGLGNVKWTSLLSIANRYCGLKVDVGAARQDNSWRPSPLAFNVRVALRRYLSEIRDNYVNANSVFAKAYRLMRG